MFNTKILLSAALVTAGIVGGIVFGLSLQNGDRPRETPNDWEEANNDLQRQEGEPFSELEDRLSPDSERWETLLEENPEVVELGVNHIELGDQLLLVGNVNSAYHQYIKATNDFSADLPPSLLLRLAIATEQMGEDENANRYYQNVVRLSPETSLFRLLGLTGVARTWQNEGLFSDAHEVLGELMLIYLSNEQLHEEIRFQIVCQLSSLIEVKCLASLPQQSSLDTLEFNWPEPSIDAMVEILQKFGDVVVQNDTANFDAILVETLQRPSEDINQIAVDAKAPLTSIEKILDQLAERSRVSIELSARSRNKIANRSLRLNVAGLSVASVLDLSLYPLGLVWNQNGDQIQVSMESEPGVDHQAFLFGLADRTLRTIELALPEDVRRNSSLLHRGNLRLLYGDMDVAESHYDKLEKLGPNNELAAKLRFNMAMIDIRNGNLDAAVKRLWFTVDQSLSHRLQARSYAWIGRLELQIGFADRAVYALSRGVALAEDAQVKQDLLLNLAQAHLLENDPFSANRALFTHADDIVDAQKKKKAALFAAYARYLGMVPGEGLSNEGERMVIALAALSPEDTDEFIERLLIGRAFSEVGFQNRASDFLSLALESAPNEKWRRRVAFELATNHFRGGELSEASKHYRLLLVGEPDDSSRMAQMKLAEIALKLREYDSCISICRDVWKQEIGDAQKMETLSLMGKAFQQKGRYRTAAACFSGVFPDESGNLSAEPNPTASVN